MYQPLNDGSPAYKAAATCDERRAELEGEATRRSQKINGR
jgi:hypothetical protein